MEHESDPSSDSSSDQEPEHPDDQDEDEQLGCGTIIFRVVVAGIVIFLAAVAFIFGACLLS